MKNIIEILKGHGIEIAEDQTDAITKEVAENYKTVAEFDKKVSRLETERDGLQEQLKTANTSLEGFKGVDLESLKKEIADAKQKAIDAENEYKTKIAQRDYEDALKTGMGQYKFSSKAAKNSIFERVKGAELKCVEGKIIGLDDYINSLKEEDASAFVDDDNNDPGDGGNSGGRFTRKIETGGSGKKYTSRDEIMKIKSAKERQAAIAENYQLFQ